MRTFNFLSAHIPTSILLCAHLPAHVPLVGGLSLFGFLEGPSPLPRATNQWCGRRTEAHLPRDLDVFVDAAAIGSPGAPRFVFCPWAGGRTATCILRAPFGGKTNRNPPVLGAPANHGWRGIRAACYCFLLLVSWQENN